MSLTAIAAAKAAGEPVRRCTSCAQWLPLSEYRQRSNRPAGQLTSRCRHCLNQAIAAWRSLNPGYNVEWRAANPQKLAAYHSRTAAHYAALAPNINKDHTPCPPQSAATDVAVAAAASYSTRPLRTRSTE
jgi:hypothetical protein